MKELVRRGDLDRRGIGLGAVYTLSAGAGLAVRVMR